MRFAFGGGLRRRVTASFSIVPPSLMEYLDSFEYRDRLGGTRLHGFDHFFTPLFGWCLI